MATTSLPDCEALELWVLQGGPALPWVVCARAGDDLAIEQVDFEARVGTLDAFANRIRATIRGGANSPTASELHVFGLELAEVLLPGRIRALYDRVNSSEYVPLQLLTNDPRIKRLPWEYFQDIKGSPGPNANRPVARIVPTVGFDSSWRPKKNARLRALFAVAEPLDQTSVSWSLVYRTFQETLKPFFDVQLLEHASRESLWKTLSRGDWHLFHFSGHGNIQNDTGCLILEDAEQLSEYVAAEDVAALLSNRKIRLAVLAACSTAQGAATDDFSTIAETLVRRYIPAVVANQAAVPDEMAALFSQAFYETLMQPGEWHGDVDHAVEAARGRLALVPHGRDRARLSWGIPTVYRHVRCAKVFRP